jgi:cyclohexanone monooxygenase
VTVIEAQARYVVRAIRTAGRAQAQALTVLSEAQNRFQQTVRDKYARTVWALGGCRSWHQNGSPSGTLLWPDSTVAYRWRLRRLRRSDFQFIRQ